MASDTMAKLMDDQASTKAELRTQLEAQGALIAELRDKVDAQSKCIAKLVDKFNTQPIISPSVYSAIAVSNYMTKIFGYGDGNEPIQIVAASEARFNSWLADVSEFYGTLLKEDNTLDFRDGIKARLFTYDLPKHDLLCILKKDKRLIERHGDRVQLFDLHRAQLPKDQAIAVLKRANWEFQAEEQQLASNRGAESQPGPRDFSTYRLFA
ncbi:hypothetical protein BDW69DRAFT_180036 [Aspergillus filifer]